MGFSGVQCGFQGESIEFHREPRTITKFMEMWPPSVFEILKDLDEWCLSISDTVLKHLLCDR